MSLQTRKVLDKAFSGFGLIAIAVMAVANLSAIDASSRVSTAADII